MSGPLFEQYKAALRRGHVAALAGSLDEALDAYRTASRLVPERALPLASQGTVLHRLGRWPEAAEAFDRALRLAPDDEAALRARATAREQRGLRSGAAADFERLAFVLEVGGRVDQAAEAARRSVELEPNATRMALADRLAASVERPDPGVGTAAGDSASLPPVEVIEEPTTVAGEVDAGGVDADPADVAADSGAALDLALAAAAEEALAAAAEEAMAARPAEGQPPVEEEPTSADVRGAEAEEAYEAEEGHATNLWPPVDLPSPPPPPLVGPPPDPETLLAEAVSLMEAGQPLDARDRMLTAVTVHRAAGRADAALDVCLQLLAIEPGDPQVHLALANLQLDHGWTTLATEKIELLIRLTSLTGDTQAEADAHGLASERLRDVPAQPIA